MSVNAVGESLAQIPRLKALPNEPNCHFPSLSLLYYNHSLLLALVVFYYTVDIPAKRI